jgi:serine/threonine protein kinase
MGSNSSKEGKWHGCTSKDFVELKDLGKGSFGTVKLVTWRKSSDKIFALKKIRYGGFFNQSTKDMIAKEISAQQQLVHPNVAKLETYWYETGLLYGGCGHLLLEYCSRGSARQFAGHDTVILNPVNYVSITSNPQFIAQAWDMAEQILSALVYVHSQNVIHRDIKLDNILIHEDGTFKLADFGVSIGREEGMAEVRQELSKPEKYSELTQRGTVCARTQCGTMLYMAPEVIMGAPYGKGVDMYALGLAIREMTGRASIMLDESFDMTRLLQRKGTVVESKAAWALPLVVCGVFCSRNMERLGSWLRPFRPFFVLWSPCVFLAFAFAPWIAYRCFYTFLRLHILLFALMCRAVLERQLLWNLSDCLIAANPSERPSAADSLAYVRFCKKVFNATWFFDTVPLVFWGLFPFDMMGFVQARWLTQLLLFLISVLLTILFWPRSTMVILNRFPTATDACVKSKDT